MSNLFLSDFFIRLCINTLSIIILIRFCYYPYSRHRANASSFMLFGMGVFLVTALLHKADISMGFAFGLFAVFSMLRYRTESISIKEMTYLFLVIAIALLSAVGTMPFSALLLITLCICFLAFILETSLVLPLIEEREIIYDKIENITPEREPQIIKDLELRTGLDIKHIEIISTDFLRDSSRIKLHYTPKKKLPTNAIQTSIDPTPKQENP